MSGIYLIKFEHHGKLGGYFVLFFRLILPQNTRVSLGTTSSDVEFALNRLKVRKTSKIIMLRSILPHGGLLFLAKKVSDGPIFVLELVGHSTCNQLIKPNCVHSSFQQARSAINLIGRTQLKWAGVDLFRLSWACA